MKELPDEVLSQICRAAIEQQTACASTLLTVARSWHDATARVLYRSLTMQDDDCLLLLAADADGLPMVSVSKSIMDVRMPKSIRQLRSIYINELYGGCVQSLNIVPGKPAWRNGIGQFNDMFSSSASNSSLSTDDPPTLPYSNPEPLDDFALGELIRTRLTNLKRFSWSASRPPPDLVIDALSKSSNLYFFSAWSKIHSHSSLDPVFRFPSNDEAKSLMLDPLDCTRWDGSCLSRLPLGVITQLHLQNLSSTGIRCMCDALFSLTGLEQLVLENTLFVDDVLLTGLSEHCIRLQALSIRNMAGTKVTSKGMATLLETSNTLEKLELIEFEGTCPKKPLCECHADSGQGDLRNDAGPRLHLILQRCGPCG